MAEAREYLSHQEKMGSIQISDEVVATIAANATTEVDGVSGLMNGNMADYVSGKNKKMTAKGVRVEMNEDGITVNLLVMLRYGCTVGDVAKKIQNAVFTALESMTGLKIRAVNVHIGGISFN